MRIGSLFGIEITIHASWIFVFALVTWALSNPLGPLQVGTASPILRAALAVVGSLLFFASVLLHELAHSLLARARGIPVRGITLFVFGGVSLFEREAADAPGEAWISGIGPLTSLVLGGLFWVIADVLPAGPIAALARYLSAANAVLAAFNILPAYPLDGGRVLHALIWRATGNRARATAITANVGGSIAALLIVAGCFDALLADFAGGLWITFIGWFLLQAGNAERSGAALARALQGHTAVELATPRELSVSADASARRALAVMSENRLRALPVVLGERIIGVLELDEFATRTDEELDVTPVTALMKRPDALTVVPAATSAGDALTALARAHASALGLVAPNGDLIGVFTSESVMRWLAAVQQPQPS
jgi:Zn-dependent protease/CBS domain-containing protein